MKLDENSQKILVFTLLEILPLSISFAQAQIVLEILYQFDIETLLSETEIEKMLYETGKLLIFNPFYSHNGAVLLFLYGKSRKLSEMESFLTEVSPKSLHGAASLLKYV